ncbi:MAG: type I methionyl aminopeptidase [Ruminococcaceae bacterium]|nr:type I methionyl aminopeptidase [Oscillospiraceae bacterium]
MIQIKNAEQIKAMRLAGRITGEALLVVREALKDGVTTKHIDDLIRKYIEKCGATPSFLGYGGFTGSACISINDEVIHGIPSEKRYIREGDIVKIDVGACIHGVHGDSANTFAVGSVSAEATALAKATKESFFEAIKCAKPGFRIGDIGHAVEAYVTERGYSVVREFVGHGIGKDLHEDPSVPNYGTPGRGARLFPGMAIAIEPMVNAGSSKIRQLADGWTVKTADGALSAHYEHTVLITEEEPELLTYVG